MMGKRALIGVLVSGIALGFVPAGAESQCGVRALGNAGNVPVPGVGMVAGVDGVPANNAPGQSCTFAAGPTPHGYVSSTSTFRIFLDPNNNQKADSGEQVLVAPGAPPAGSFAAAAGALVTVQILGTCTDFGCGYLGFVVVI